MKTVMIVVSVAMAALAVRVPAQRSPPGGPPAPAGDWIIEYRGDLNALPRYSGWHKPEWQSAAPATSFGDSAVPSDASIRGTVQVRLRWNRTDSEPPSQVNLAVASSVSGYSDGHITANNGFESMSQPEGGAGAQAGGRYLVGY